VAHPGAVMAPVIFLVFLVAAQVRFGKAQCSEIAQPTQRELCLARQIDNPQSYLLAWRIGRVYAAAGKKKQALIWLREARKLALASQPQYIAEIDRAISKVIKPTR